MTEPFVVEVWGKPAGVVVKEGNAFRFYAIASPLLRARRRAVHHARACQAGGGAARRVRRHDADDGHSTVTGRSLGSASHSASILPL